MNLQSLGVRYLIKLDEEKKTDGLFVIPKDSRLIPQRGIVVGVNKDNAFDLHLNQVVYLLPDSGYEITVDGVEYRSVKDVEIIAKEI